MAIDFFVTGSLLDRFLTKINDLFAPKSHTHNYAGSSYAGGSAKSAAKLDNLAVVDTHGEGARVVIPFVMSDIAFFRARGGTFKVTNPDGSNNGVNLDACFNGTSDYCFVKEFDTPGDTVIELTLFKTFTWSNAMGISFGSVSWRAKHVKFEVMHAGSDTEYTTKWETTNNGVNVINFSLTHKDGTGFNRVRITLGNWANASDKRIAGIWILNYGSRGINETLLSRNGDGMYGTIYPVTNKGADLGKSDKKFGAVYSDTFNGYTIGKSVPSDAKFTDTTYSAATQSKAGLMSAADKTKLYSLTGFKRYQDVAVAANAWVADTTYPDYPYRANVALTGVKATMIADVVFAPQDAQSGLYAPVCNTYDGGVQLWARYAQAVTIKTIKIKE